jgi:hypothetical protein
MQYVQKLHQDKIAIAEEVGASWRIMARRESRFGGVSAMNGLLPTAAAERTPNAKERSELRCTAFAGNSTSRGKKRVLASLRVDAQNAFVVSRAHSPATVEARPPGTATAQRAVS